MTAHAGVPPDRTVGLSTARAVELLCQDGPNALPTQRRRPGWLRFLDEYRGWMQIILVVAAVVALLIARWDTAALLVVLTIVNAVLGLRQRGRADNAADALRSMVRPTARVRRDGTESEITADQLVIGDVVHIDAGDHVPADGRVIAASGLRIDESPLTGERTPVPKAVSTMAFMNTSVTNGNGTMIVTATGADTEFGRISGLLSTTAHPATPLARELDRLTLWFAAAAGLTMIVMFALGLHRGLAWHTLIVSALTLAISAIPEALPTVSRSILSVGAVELARRGAIVKDLPSVETLGLASAINSGEFGTHTRNRTTRLGAAARAAHIRIRVVTAAALTDAIAIARQVGIEGDAMLGTDFAVLSPADRAARIDGIGVLARVTPEHEVLVTDALKRRGEIIAVTGDGVNDAPAVQAADIGIAMGSGTDVTKNAARMILTDDDLATVIDAVEHGRAIHDNLTKYIRFVVVLLTAFVLTFLGASLFDIAHGKPFTPAQDLWIHFVVNAPFGFALGFDYAASGLMARYPKPRGEPVLTTRVMVALGLIGAVIAVELLTLTEIDGGADNSVAFTAFALCLMVAALECRSTTDSVLTTATFDSKRMNWVLLGEFTLAVLSTRMEALRHLLGTVPLGPARFGWALAAAVALFVLWELGKLAARRRRDHRIRSTRQEGHA